LLADVVAASQQVGETSARSRKIAILAELLRTLEPGEVALATGFLSGIPRQGRVGVGYSMIYGVELSAAGSASLTVDDLDTAITEIEAATGSGSATRRRQLLSDLLVRATADEADFIHRLFTGELRQGALSGLMIDAVAKAAAVPADLARRVLMLSGGLPRTAELWGCATTGRRRSRTRLRRSTATRRRRESRRFSSTFSTSTASICSTRPCASARRCSRRLRRSSRSPAPSRRTQTRDNASST